MKSWFVFSILLLMAVTSCVAPAVADERADAAAVSEVKASPAVGAAPVSLFDPARHMHVSEVNPGMTGYGLSVFSGTKIERFEVEVISVLHNFNPKGDVVLIKCRGMNLEHTGAVAGMSGSPIFLNDDQGKARMIGAFAYGWPMTKDPLAGVQPIEYMLKIGEGTRKSLIGDGVAGAASEKPAASKGSANQSTGVKLQWSLSDSPYFPASKALSTLAGRATANDLATASARPRLGDGDVQLQPLATPLMVSGVSPKLLEQFGPLFKQAGLVPLQAGGAGAGPAGPDEVKPKLEPGSVLAVPLVLGDMEMSALGTTTEALGDRVFGFGHPFNNEGAVVLPMGTGRISHVIPNLTTSFKLGALASTVGTLVSDQSVGVGGKVGGPPPMVPIDIKISYTDGTPDRNYHFEGALHPRFTPLIVGLALNSAISGAHELPQYNTLDYDLKMEFANGRSVQVQNRAVNSNPMELFADAGMPLMIAADNPFERVMIKRVTGTVRVADDARDATIVEVTVPKTKYRPGETVAGFVTFKPFRAQERTLPIELKLPDDLPEGTYQLVISDWRRYLMDEQQQKPFRFTAEKIGDVFDALKEATSFRHNALYVRLMRQPDGVAVGRTAMPQLPSSRRTVLMGAGRSTTTRFVSSTVKIIPTEQVMQGAADFVLTIDAKAKVSTGKPAPGNPAPLPANVPPAGVTPAKPATVPPATEPPAAPAKPADPGKGSPVDPNDVP